MTSCQIYNDWPLRAKITSGGVVHAARPTGTRYSDKWYKDVDTFIACRRSYRRLGGKDYTLILIPSDTPITCKDCLRELGDTDYRKEVSERFVIMDKDELFLKSGRTLRTGEVADAKLFKLKAPAVRWITRRFYMDGAGNEIELAKFFQLGRDNMPRSEGKRLAKGYRIFKIIIRLGEEIKLPEVS